jgi:hypothetical protein
MTVSKAVANDPWMLDDWWRRTVMQLFNDQLSPARQNRNRQYREGLLTLIEGLTHENPFDVSDGIDQIGRVFGGTLTGQPKMHQDDRSGDTAQTRNQPQEKTSSGFPWKQAMGTDEADE